MTNALIGMCYSKKCTGVICIVFTDCCMGCSCYKYHANNSLTQGNLLFYSYAK